MEAAAVPMLRVDDNLDIELLATTRVGSSTIPKNLEVTGAIAAQAVTVGGRAVVVDDASRLTIWEGSIGTAQLADRCITNLKVAPDAGVSMSKIRGLTEASPTRSAGRRRRANQSCQMSEYLHGVRPVRNQLRY